jgi:hypothetical protein
MLSWCMLSWFKPILLSNIYNRIEHKLNSDVQSTISTLKLFRFANPFMHFMGDQNFLFEFYGKL